MNKKKLIFLCAVFLLTNSCLSLKNGLKEGAHRHELVDQRLSGEVIPLNYHLTLWANPKDEKFSGLVLIDIEVKFAQRHIILHGQQLAIKSVELVHQLEPKAGTLTLINDDGLAALDFGGPIKAGQYQLAISYDGIFQEDLSGLYRVKDGEEYYLYTQFEPLSARKMLPCFDEPRFKAPFELSVISPTGQVVVANSLLKKTHPSGLNTVHVFDKTAPIPTYLLALAVGPFDVVEGAPLGHDKNIPFRGIATRGKGPKLALAMRETPAILAKLEDYFGVPYPFHKLDILAVPDFSAGAMENVGAITFREWYLLMEPNASAEQQQGFYVVMAHELAHQWFGNLVTMPWWNDLWLNEAFATWLSYKIIDQIRPEFSSSEKLLERSHRAMTKDSLTAARKICEPIRSTHDIYNAFDGITYSKGGAVLASLENYLGAELFRKAVSAHIKRFRYGNATSQDFLASLAQFSTPQLVSSAETFLNQSGVPVIDFSYACHDGGFEMKLSQQRYAPLGSKISIDRSWHIPLCIGYEIDGVLKKHCFMLDQRKLNIRLESQQCPSFIMPNFNGQGYYRFALSADHWQRLLEAPAGLLSEADRIAIADSLVAEQSRNRLDFGLVANGLRDMSSARSATITRYFMNLIDETQSHWLLKSNQPELTRYASQILRPIYDELSAQSKLNPDQQGLKGDLASFLANRLHDKQARLDLDTMGIGYLSRVLKVDKSVSSFDENMLGEALGVALQNQDDQGLSGVISALGTENDTVTRKNILSALAQCRLGEKADVIRKLVFDKNLRKNEKLSLLYQHLENSHNQPTTWNFLTNNLDQFKDNLSKAQLGNLPQLAQGLCTLESALEVRQLLTPHINEYPGGPRNLAEAIEQVEICAAKRQQASVLANNFFAVQTQEVVDKQSKK